MVHEQRSTTLDLHHNILPPISGRSPNIGLFVQKEHNLRGENVKTFVPAGMTLHSVVHLFFEESFSKAYRDLSDIHLLLEEFSTDEIFWQDLVLLARQSGFIKELFLALRYSRAQFGTSVPSAIMLELEKSVRSKLLLSFYDALFARLLSPLQNGHTRSTLVEMIGLLRGHLLKMPFLTLLSHTAHKLKKAIKPKSEINHS